MEGLSVMTQASACALLHTLGDVNLRMGNVIIGQTSDDERDGWADTEQRVIVELLTALLGRPPLDEEIQAATAL